MSRQFFISPALDEFDLHKEPQYHFTPLTSEKYSELYDIEMASFTEDVPFYLQYTKPSGNTLELGCGTGRLTKKLAQTGQQITAVDISFPMLKRAATTSSTNIDYICGDMTNVSLRHQFDTIVIPYNTLNLLVQPSQIANCFSLCNQALKSHGKLLFQVFIPEDELVRNLSESKLFQFQIFNAGTTTRVIKETIKSYNSTQKILLLEERYRIRTKVNKTLAKEDYSHAFDLVAIGVKQWVAFLEEAGFAINSLYDSYQLSGYVPGNSSILLVVAKKIGPDCQQKALP